MKTESITERIIKQADDQLTRQCNEAGNEFRRLINDGHIHELEFTQGDKIIAINYHTVLDTLSELAFELRRDRERQMAIDAFMSKVESLTTELEELKTLAG